MLVKSSQGYSYFRNMKANKQSLQQTLNINTFNYFLKQSFLWAFKGGEAKKNINKLQVPQLLATPNIWGLYRSIGQPGLSGL